MIEKFELTCALWSAVADTARSTDRMARAGGLDSLRYFVGEMANQAGASDDLKLWCAAELARLEAF